MNNETSTNAMNITAGHYGAYNAAACTRTCCTQTTTPNTFERATTTARPFLHCRAIGACVETGVAFAAAEKAREDSDERAIIFTFS